MPLKQILITFLFAILPVIIYGQENEKQTNSEQRVIIRKSDNKISQTRPHAPSNQFIVMSYDAEQGICTFELPEDVSFITVEFTETETDWTVTETAPATDPVIHITLMPATYTVTCTTDNGSVYRGEFSTTKF